MSDITKCTGHDKPRQGKTPEDGYRRLSQAVLTFAFADLAGISPYLYDTYKLTRKEEHRDSAALWFANDDFEPWCEMADLDSKDVKEAAILIAERVKYG